jgi:hypothetical protein
VTKKPKKPKKIKDKDVAWTPEKNQLLGNMFRERLSVEGDVSSFQEWGLTRSWANILNTHLDDVTKQLILNDLIDDKLDYLTVRANQASASVTAIGLEVIDLTSNKE